MKLTKPILLQHAIPHPQHRVRTQRRHLKPVQLPDTRAIRQNSRNRLVVCFPVLQHFPRCACGVVDVDHTRAVPSPQIVAYTHQRTDLVHTDIHNTETLEPFLRIYRNFPVGVSKVNAIWLTAHYRSRRHISNIHLRQGRLCQLYKVIAVICTVVDSNVLGRRYPELRSGDYGKGMALWNAEGMRRLLK